MQSLLQDFRFAFRQLLKNPGFSAVAVLTLALGIGVNLALFAILNELLLRRKPVARPDELWAIQPATASGEPVYANVCRPYYEAIRREGRVLKGVIGYASIMPKLRTKEGAERLIVELVSGDYFSFLGVTPAMGRGFLPEEETQIGAHSVAVISHAFWQSQFAGAADVLGKTVTVNDKAIEIVGVAPRGFTGLDFIQPALWLPSSMERMLDQHTIYRLVGRLDEPRQAAAAADLLSPIAADVSRELRGFKDPQWSRYGASCQAFRLESIGRGVLGPSQKPRVVGFLMFGGVATALLLCIASANAASLFLARALQHRKEMATRVALGATRLKLVRQLVCEGLVLAVGGTIGALLSFSWIGPAMMKFAGWRPGASVSPVPDLQILLFAVGGALLVGVGFSLAPALHATGFDPFAALKEPEGSSGPGRRRARLRHGLIIAQIVGCLVLLSGASLCLRSMSRQLSVDVGFRSDRLAIASLNLERIGFTTNTLAPRLAEIVRRVGLIPGVERVGVSSVEPLTGFESSQALPQIEGYRAPDGKNPEVAFADVGPGCFAALGIPVLYGREISQEDIDLDRRVIVVNQSFVEQFWPGQEPLGKRVVRSEVIGVVQDARFSRFNEPPRAMTFRAARKASLLQPTLLIQTRKDSRQMVSAVRAELVRIDPKLLQGDVCTLRDTMKKALAIQHAALRILAVLAGLALALAVIGTYGVMAYLVTSRTREIGIRLAVGATRGNVTGLILTAGLRLGLVALVISLPLAIGAAALLRHHLAGISPFDPISFAAATACVLGAVVIACWLPARRAARIDPMEALRYE